jgi:hypothetical protein
VTTWKTWAYRKDNIKMGVIVRENWVGGRGLDSFASGLQWQDLVNTVMNLRVL